MTQNSKLKTIMLRHLVVITAAFFLDDLYSDCWYYSGNVNFYNNDAIALTSNERKKSLSFVG